ncbi:hypothetical protein [Asticcacaulis taihuensis]|uniref:hypothetical protein n=1 Tax=Asticcacaulis taihuensis TaxID=260084 RepID=UPI0026EB609D|nr:hypothetical protein [Asticcacaulis taihuensis]
MTPAEVRVVMDALWRRLTDRLIDLTTGEAVERAVDPERCELSDWALSALRAARTITDLRRLAEQVAKGYGLKLEDL